MEWYRAITTDINGKLVERKELNSFKAANKYAGEQDMLDNYTVVYDEDDNIVIG